MAADMSKLTEPMEGGTATKFAAAPRKLASVFSVDSALRWSAVSLVAPFSVEFAPDWTSEPMALLAAAATFRLKSAMACSSFRAYSFLKKSMASSPSLAAYFSSCSACLRSLARIDFNSRCCSSVNCMSEVLEPGTPASIVIASATANLPFWPVMASLPLVRFALCPSAACEALTLAAIAATFRLNSKMACSSLRAYSFLKKSTASLPSSAAYFSSCAACLRSLARIASSWCCCSSVNRTLEFVES
mmetsp:Transcript_129720/g.315110  ORF Transcript_129720/g.315110 Transcript_129720/m.315110 type:complete len:246 (-) Transcript_129720:517-1254(-)